jgi:molybdenum cofactor synthesis domain-containing protein
MRNKTAAAIIIGNEILSGKVVDLNAAFLARELRGIGVSLERIVVIPDDIEVIGTTVREHASRCDVVFTSGGVGPTHDDITMAGIAHGLGRAVVRHPVLVEKMREFTRGELTEPKLKMTEVPEGAEPIFEGTIPFPVVRVDNVYVLPGIPELFREKFLSIRARFAVDPYFVRVVYTRAPETVIAGHLNSTLAAFPALLLGSYPKMSDPDYQVRVTLESKDESYVNRALDHLVSCLPPETIVRTE